MKYVPVLTPSTLSTKREIVRLWWGVDTADVVWEESELRAGDIVILLHEPDSPSDQLPAPRRVVRFDHMRGILLTEPIDG